MLALLKPIVKVAKVILVPALFELVKVSKSVVVVIIVIIIAWRVSVKCFVARLRRGFVVGRRVGVVQGWRPSK